METHAAICVDSLQQRMLPLDTVEAKPMIEHWPADSTVGFESMVRPIIGSQDNEHGELDHFILRYDGDPSFIRKSTYRQSLGYRINGDHGAKLLDIYAVNPKTSIDTGHYADGATPNNIVWSPNKIQHRR